MRLATSAALASALVLVAVAAVPRASAQTSVPVAPSEGVHERVREKLTAHRNRVVAEPRDADAWGRYGMVLDAHRMTAPAIVVYSEAWRLDPNEFRWPYFLGSILEYEDPASAITWFERALEIDSNYAPAQIRAAQTLENLGRDEEARAHYRRAFDLDTSNALASLGLGRLALATGDVGEAIRRLERAYELDPNTQAVVATLARAYNRGGQRGLAREKANEARSLPRMTHHPDARRASVQAEAVDNEGYLRRARTAVEVGHLDRARSELEALVRLEPELAAAHFSLAGVYDRLGIADLTLGSAQRAFELDPNLKGSGAVVAGALFKLGRMEEARDRAQSVLLSEPENEHMLVILSLSAAQDGRVEDLLDTLGRAYGARTPESPMRPIMMRMLADVAESFSAVGQNDVARHWMQKALVVAQESGDKASADEFRSKLRDFN